jgi:tetratricopeptide (TPR) repeat protein
MTPISVKFAVFSMAAALMSASVSAPAAAQTAAERWEEARSYYAEGDFEAALPGAIAAVQQAPAAPEYYLGAARILFQMERYDEAVFYYDIYIQHFGPILPADTPERNRLTRAREERTTANNSRTTPSSAVPEPAGQGEARAALVARIAEGIAITPTGGGALAIYDALLRTGYARPDLLTLRSELRACILEEASLFVAVNRAAMPALSIEEWEVQRTRMQRYVDLAPEPLPTASGQPREVANAGLGLAMLELAQGQLRYLNQDFTAAAERFGAALTAQPDFLPAHVGRLNALFSAERGLTSEAHQALAAFQTLAEASATDPEIGLLASIYEAAFVAQSGDRDEAITLIEAMLGY